jgi:hypothetical protein
VTAPTAPAGHFTKQRFGITKQRFGIDLDQGTVTCPARLQVPILPARGGGGVARFSRACAVCPLQGACTSSLAGRTITIHPQEARLAAARARQRDPAWRADYRAHRPTVERKLAPPATPPPRRPTSPGARPAARRPGLAAAGRRGQPGPLRRAWRAPTTRRLGGRPGVATSAGTPRSCPPAAPGYDPRSDATTATLSRSSYPIGHQRPSERLEPWSSGCGGEGWRPSWSLT